MERSAVATTQVKPNPYAVFWRFSDVETFLNVSRSTIYRLMREDPEFPQSFNITPKLIGWYRTEIEQYALTVRERNAAAAKRAAA